MNETQVTPEAVVVDIKANKGLTCKVPCLSYPKIL